MICLTCQRVHGRDTHAPIQCPHCKQLIGCFYHRRNIWHIKVCQQGGDLEQAWIDRTYWEKRADGWPFCPRCGEDELWSGLAWDGKGERPSMKAYIMAGLTCYKCNWKSEDLR
jgi:hypothetical protein